MRERHTSQDIPRAEVKREPKERIVAEIYDVISQDESIELSPTGATQKVVVVTYVTKPSGVRGTVTIPYVDLTPDKVAKAIEADAAIREQIQTL
jgi:hypothetical protein